MRVLRLHGRYDLRLAEEPPPCPSAGEALVRVAAVGICGSDLHWYAHAAIGADRLDRPLVLGHEVAAVTLDGRLVAMDPCIACGTCRQCLEGNPNLCPQQRFMASKGVDGALRDEMAWPAELLHTLPLGMTAADGAALEPLGVALHAVALGHVQPGMRVAVLGCGPVGLMAIQVARVAGASQILATDVLRHRLDAAERFGATNVLEAHEAEEAPALWAATGGEGVDVAVEAAGENAAVETAIAVARPGGTVVLAGIPVEDRTTFRASAARSKGLTLRVSRRMKHTYLRAIRLVQAGQVDVRSLVTHRFPLERYEEAFTTAERRAGLKVVIEP